MAAFPYSAINALGAESAGQITAPDAGSARELLRQKGLRPVSLSEVGATGSAEKKRKRVKPPPLQLFTRLYLSRVEAGEAAGILDSVLDRVAVQIEKEMKIKRRVKGAMVYPMVVLVFAVLVLIGMLLLLVRVFQGIF